MAKKRRWRAASTSLGKGVTRMAALSSVRSASARPCRPGEHSGAGGQALLGEAGEGHLLDLS